MISRFVLILYCASLLLLPWGWFPPFPWLHLHAQWSDVFFAITVLVWVVEHCQRRRWPRLNWSHAALAGYLIAATASLLLATAERWTGIWKLAGIAELCLLVVITSDLTSRSGVMPLVARTIAVTSIITAVAAVIGVGLFYAGVPTRLIGTYGDLVPSTGYTRAEAGTYHPNLLANFCIFAVAVITSEGSELEIWLRRLALAALWLTVMLTFSRGILAFGLAVLVKAAQAPWRKMLVAGYATFCLAGLTILTVWNLSLDPMRPFAMHFNPQPSSRWQTINMSLQSLKLHPLWGVGVGNLPGKYRGMPFDAHLTPLNIAATMGLPALIAFVSLPIVLWRKRARPTDLALWGGLAGMALDGLANDIEDFRHLWVLFGLANAKVASDEHAPDRVVHQYDLVSV